jgi:hypothetical protein
MAQRTQVVLTDDIDGSEADTTIRFAVDGTASEIDLNAVHAEEFRKALRPSSTPHAKLAAALPGVPVPAGLLLAPAGLPRPTFAPGPGARASRSRTRAGFPQS